jgi:phage repressor protein C with HTH and peptisase S24 domain
MNEKSLTIERNTAQTDESSGFQSRLKKVVESFGSNSALARSIGSSETAIRKWVNGISEPKQSSIVAIARTANISLEWLMTGEGQMKGGISRSFESPVLELDERLRNGFIIWIADSDNMEPSIHQGEICLIESYSDIGNAKNGIYLIDIHGTMQVRRLQRLPKGIALTNDNLAYRASDILIDRKAGRKPPLSSVGSSLSRLQPP